MVGPIASRSSLGGRLPGPAVFTLLALAVMLGLMVLLVLLAAIGLGPERPGSLGPVPTPPHFEARVGDSVALAAGHRTAFVARGVAVSEVQRSPAPSARRPESETEAVPTVAPAQAVAVAGPTQPQAPAPAPAAQPVSVPAPAPEAAPAPVVTAALGPSGGSSGEGGPIAAGVEPKPVCEGDEYTITLTVKGEETAEEPPLLEILLARRGQDGSSDELLLEGSLADARSLIGQLLAEGSCVEVELIPAPGEVAAPEMSEVVPGADETSETLETAPR